MIANAYRRLNLWNANCGASFERAGRAVSPSPGFVTGWLMITGTLIGTLSPVVAAGPNILAVAGGPAGNKAGNAVVATAVALVMLVISVTGIRLSARTQVAIGIIEYALLVVISVAGLAWVLGHHPGSFPLTRQWFSLTLYVNEDVKHRAGEPVIPASRDNG